MLLRGGGWGAPGKGCAASADRAAVPCPIEHTSETTAIAAIIMARLPLLRDGTLNAAMGLTAAAGADSAPRLYVFYLACLHA